MDNSLRKGQRIDELQNRKQEEEEEWGNEEEVKTG